jgi:UDP-N-acetyl-D-mannosaminuronic acid dehydrogenase
MGYIGLPTGALLANKGYEVVGVDVVESVVDTINRGEIHIVEPELDRFVKSAVDNKHLSASLTPAEADVFIIAVPTPFHEGHVPNTDYIVSATKAIAPFVKPGNIVILESTSPVGTTHNVEKQLKEEGVDTTKIHVAHCPERVLPGQIMRELIENDRIVGGNTEEATKATADFYREFVNGAVLETDSNTAEMAKLTENSFRDVNIAFANELSMLCDKFGIDVWELIRLANHHPRVNVLYPGVGVGGHCIAVDPWFIIHKAQGDAKIIQTAREVNLAKTDWVIDKIKAAAYDFEKEHGRAAKIACLGLAYKPNIDDLRESPAVDIVKKLQSSGMNLVVVEPNIESHPDFEINKLEDISDTDIVIVLVAHDEFIALQHSNLINFCG